MSIAIESEGMQHQIALRLKCIALVIKPRVEHRAAGLAGFWA